MASGETERLTRRGLRLARFTVAYNVAEGMVAVTAGLLAGPGDAGFLFFTESRGTRQWWVSRFAGLGALMVGLGGPAAELLGLATIPVLDSRGIRLTGVALPDARVI